MIERDIEQYACQKARKLGWFVRKLSWIGCDAAPDRIFAKDSQIFFVEFKKPGEVLRDNQVWEHREMAKYGIKVAVIDSMEGVDAFFQRS